MINYLKEKIRKLFRRPKIKMGKACFVSSLELENTPVMVIDPLYSPASLSKMCSLHQQKNVFIFSPNDSKSGSYNPLEAMSENYGSI